MQKKFLIPLFITLIFNTLVAVLLFLLLGDVDFSSLLFISHSIGLSVLGANFLISFEQYSNNIAQIILHSLTGLLLGLMIAFIGHRLIFGIDLTYSIIYPALFFSIVAVLISWLYFSRLDNQEALDKIKRKLSAGHKKLHWIKTADSKGNVFLLNVKEIEYFQAQQKYTCVYSKGREYLITTGIKTLITQLDANYFWQIHRGSIVNISFISQVSKNEQDKLMVYLSNAQALPISRNYLHLFKKM
ncbi:hypothetical protein [uncultured Gammaproteobacteria bacterium]|jgi:membrane protein implicated in regulation of membrane protease activity|uniref:LytR/AlgR family response regulator transcription factor n=1 Tax=thiotrophic endosymbiont of Bathymodiolus puteoserpentis (Logatchev) TaxID=343240 RepID=UPI0010B5B598|nr:LytTR family DNA-binding domain-containing protein [thiotrophic endosymbiont of Bathymodiolus puteoserpentis (Logatchev)]CAC9483040.1 hypothetical protein [uncultured Gammaproteobacteria bacterium]CAC9491709.1 hypothetical protein [uncultured Gammaproteobacteria bacterium]CAC9576020.1 hypothetical protein [uncultured Gammaproteobacteria bacterium]CAC9578479.1 hypothetical protein [uncultured Gammaproteobacteria bacterium]CAC9589629.1 hypothetical protein [uncultured Gammaproteobacteria bact